MLGIGEVMGKLGPDVKVKPLVAKLIVLAIAMALLAGLGDRGGSASAESTLRPLMNSPRAAREATRERRSRLFTMSFERTLSTVIASRSLGGRITMRAGTRRPLRS